MTEKHTAELDAILGLVENYLTARRFEAGEQKHVLENALRAIIKERDQAVKDRNAAWSGVKTMDALVIEREALRAECDRWKQQYRELIADFMPETECPPGSKCDSYGHDDDCPVVSAQASVRKLREGHAALKARVGDLDKLNVPMKGVPVPIKQWFATSISDHDTDGEGCSDRLVRFANEHQLKPEDLKIISREGSHHYWINILYYAEHELSEPQRLHPERRAIRD